MRLALFMILSLAVLGILVRAFFSDIRPFDIVKVAIGRLPGVVREQPFVVLAAFLPFIAAPAGSLLSQAVGDHWLVRALTALAWQSVWSAVLALAAVRLHRRVIYGDRTNRLMIGPRERRMAGLVVAALILIAVVRLVPLASAALLETRGIVQSLAQVLSFVLSWSLIVLFAFVGPSASFDDAAPFRVSRDCVKAQPAATIALVLVSQVLLALVGLAITSVVLLGQMSTPLVIAAALIAVTAMVAIFIVAEVSMAIALTRIRENVYDDTRAREHNADWH